MKKVYRNKIPKIIKSIKDKHVKDEDKDQADMIFSTVHRSKGMEYDAVQVVNDFISEKKIVKLTADHTLEEVNAKKLNEEINMLYVAVTRTRNSIYIPDDLMPKDFPASSQIHVMKTMTNEEKKAKKLAKQADLKNNITKSYTLEEVRKKQKHAYLPWTVELDEELTTMYREGVSSKDMAKHFGRTRGAITSRIKKLELADLYD